LKQVKFVYASAFIALLTAFSCGKSHEKHLGKRVIDTLINKAVDTIQTNSWLPFLPDKVDTIIPVLETKFSLMEPNTGATALYIPDTLSTSKPEPDIDTITGLIPNLIKPSPLVIAAINPEPRTIKDFRSVSNTNFDIQYLDAEQGLPVSTISSIVQDKNGTLWLGTPVGLIAYDGQRIRHFSKNNGLPSESISKIIIDKKDNLWFITGPYLIKYDGVKFHIYGNDFNPTQQQVSDVYEDSNGDIWTCFMPGDLFRIDKKGIHQYVNKNWLSSGYPTAMVEDKYGKMWIGGWGGNMSIIHGDTAFIHKSRWPYRVSDVLMSGYRDKDDNLWFTSYNGGITRRDVKLENFFTFNGTNELRPTFYTGVREDLEGNFWAGSDKAGLLYFKENGESFSYTTKQGLTDNSVLDVYCDKFGIIWVGTQSGGLCKINPKSFRQLNDQDGLTSSSVISVFQDHLNTSFVGTWGDGLYIKSKDQWKEVVADMHDFIILDILEDTENNIWVSTHSWGLHRLKRSHKDSTTFEVSQSFHLGSGIPASYVYNMNLDSKGNVWLCDLNEGVFRVKNEKYFHYSVKPGSKNLPVNSAYEAPNGMLWFANVNHGISCVNGERIKHFTTKEGLLSNETKRIFASADGQIWFSYADGGFSIYNGKEFKHFKTYDKNEIAPVTGFQEGTNGTIWIATTNGLLGLIKNNSAENGYEIYPYTIADGMKTNNISRHSPYIDHNGVMWLTNGKGVTIIKENLLTNTSQDPILNLTSVTINGKYYSFNQSKDSLSILPEGINFNGNYAFSNVPKNLELKHYFNSLTFEFSGIQWKKSGRIVYRHRLKELSNEWSEATSLANITYSNLSPGFYTFEFQTKLLGENWSKGKTYTFTIFPPWWQTWWFRILSVLGILLLIYLLFRWRTSQLRQRQSELELTVKERTSEIEFQKHVIEEKQKETVDSINYARRIQYALLAHEELLKNELPEHFVLFQPKDIVSGDFYWATKTNNLFYLAVCDSTGHGVPGAFMSLLNISFLNEAINEKHMSEPGIIFDHTRKRLIENISKEGQQDGMDGVLVSFNHATKQISYTASHNAPILVSNGKVAVQPADKMPVGKGDNMHPFTTHTIEINKGDMLYLITDGYADQFGGESKAGGKKFKRSNLYALLEQIAGLSLSEQKTKLENVLNDWKGNMEQMDDICIVGIRL